MKAMVLEIQGVPLRLKEIRIPAPGPSQVLVKVNACGVCRTDLHVVDGDLPSPKLPLVPGHEIVGTVEAKGKGATKYHEGDRVGIPWLGHTCGECTYCSMGMENLCEDPLFTGYTLDGGFAQFAICDEGFCFPVPDRYSDAHAAPLLCAGLIGYRSYRMTGEAERLGLYGFGAAAHILIQLAIGQDRRVYAFTRSGDSQGQQFALSLGAAWAGGSLDSPPEKLDAAIIFAPVGGLVPAALRAVRKGGLVVCAGIHMSDIPSFPYRILWEERIVRSVANLTRSDGEEFMKLVSRLPIHTRVQEFPLEKANEALEALRMGMIEGAAVLIIG